MQFNTGFESPVCKKFRGPDETKLPAPNVIPGSHLRRFVIFVASYLVILSHSVSDLGSVISVDFFSVISDFGRFITPLQ